MPLELYVELIALRAIAAQGVLCLASLAPDLRCFLEDFKIGVTNGIECIDFDPNETGDDLNDVAAQERTRRLVIAAIDEWVSAIGSNLPSSN